jgi:hypothetical protein
MPGPTRRTPKRPLPKPQRNPSRVRNTPRRQGNSNTTGCGSCGRRR